MNITKKTVTGSLNSFCLRWRIWWLVKRGWKVAGVRTDHDPYRGDYDGVVVTLYRVIL